MLFLFSLPFAVFFFFLIFATSKNLSIFCLHFCNEKKWLKLCFIKTKIKCFQFLITLPLSFSLHFYFPFLRCCSNVLKLVFNCFKAFLKFSQIQLRIDLRKYFLVMSCYLIDWFFKINVQLLDEENLMNISSIPRSFL